MIDKLLHGNSIRQLIGLQRTGGLLEESSMNVASLNSFADGNPDTTELIEASKAAILARRHLEETVQRLSIKYGKKVNNA